MKHKKLKKFLNPTSFHAITAEKNLEVKIYQEMEKMRGTPFKLCMGGIFLEIIFESKIFTTKIYVN
jgi:hypothetical protein